MFAVTGDRTVTANDGHSTLTLTGPDGEDHAVDVKDNVVIDELSTCRRAVETGAGLALLPIHTLWPKPWARTSATSIC